MSWKDFVRGAKKTAASLALATSSFTGSGTAAPASSPEAPAVTLDTLAAQAMKECDKMKSAGVPIKAYQRGMAQGSDARVSLFCAAGAGQVATEIAKANSVCGKLSPGKSYLQTGDAAHIYCQKSKGEEPLINTFGR